MTNLHKDIFFRGLYWLEENEYIGRLQFPSMIEEKELSDAKEYISEIVIERAYKVKADYWDDEYTIEEYYHEMAISDVYVAWNKMNNDKLQSISIRLKDVVLYALSDKIVLSDCSIDEAFDAEFEKIMIEFVNSITNKVL